MSGSSTHLLTLLLSLTVTEGCTNSTLVEPQEQGGHHITLDEPAVIQTEGEGATQEHATGQRLVRARLVEAARLSAQLGSGARWFEQARELDRVVAHLCDTLPPSSRPLLLSSPPERLLDHALCGLLAPPSGPSAFMVWKRAREAKLRDIDAIEKIDVFSSRHSKSLLFKLRYDDGTSALFKANHKKWDAEETRWRRRPRKPLQPEMAVYALAEPLTDLLQYRYPPTVELRLTRRQIKQLARDNPRTYEDEEEHLKDILGGIEGEPKPAYDRHSKDLSGVAVLWIRGETRIPGVIHKFKRADFVRFAEDFEEEAARIPDHLVHQLCNVILMDFLVMNNDRPGNMIFDLEAEVLFAIDNDNAFASPEKKTFNRGVFETLPVYDPVLVAALERYFEANDEATLAATIFQYYPRRVAREYAQALRERFYKEVLVEVAKKRPLGSSPPPRPEE